MLQFDVMYCLELYLLIFFSPILKFLKKWYDSRVNTEIIKGGVLYQKDYRLLELGKILNQSLNQSFIQIHSGQKTQSTSLVYFNMFIVPSTVC